MQHVKKAASNGNWGIPRAFKNLETVNGSAYESEIENVLLREIVLGPWADGCRVRSSLITRSSSSSSSSSRRTK